MQSAHSSWRPILYDSRTGTSKACLRSYTVQFEHFVLHERVPPCGDATMKVMHTLACVSCIRILASSAFSKDLLLHWDPD